MAALFCDEEGIENLLMKVVFDAKQALQNLSRRA